MATRRTRRRQATVRDADRAFSLYVRTRDGRCLGCGSRDRLQCAHIQGRAYYGVRFDPENAVALCSGCHVRWTHDPEGWREWVEENFPGRWGEIRTRQLAYEARGARNDYARIVRHYTDQLNGLLHGASPASMIPSSQPGGGVDD